MKELEGWVKIKKYTDEGKPKCNFMCKLLKWSGRVCAYSVDKHPGPSCPVWHGESKSDNQLLSACQAAYRKHHLNDDSIGWDELDTILLDALCNSMEDSEFNSWLSAQENKP